MLNNHELVPEYEFRHIRYERRPVRTPSGEEVEGLCNAWIWLDNQAQLNSYTTDAVKEVMLVDPNVEAEELDTARREALRAQRSALIGLLTDGVISEEVYSQLARGIDIQLARSQENWINLIKEKVLEPTPITHLMATIVQVQDVENAINALNEAGIPVTRLPSTGGFLGRRNVTLLIGFIEGQEEQIVHLLAENCRRRVEYRANPVEGIPFNLPPTTPVTVGGATLFKLAVERYEIL